MSPMMNSIPIAGMILVKGEPARIARAAFVPRVSGRAEEARLRWLQGLLFINCCVQPGLSADLNQRRR